jgi:hypothetical protein
MKGSSHSVGPTRVLSHPELRESSQKPQNWIGSTIAIIFLTVIFVLTASSAQIPGQPGTSDTHTQQQTQSGNPQQTEVSGPSPASTIVTEEKEKTKKKKPDRRGSILIAPLPIVSPAIGNGLIPIVGYIFPFSKNDKESPPSTIGALGMVTNNGSRGFALGGQLFLKQNTYEVTFGYGKGNLNYNLYGIGTIAALQGL